MPETSPVIDIRNLVRRYGRTEAVDGLSLRVEPGRWFGFFGRNGAGKTTTIKCLLNLLRPTSGEARVFGFDPARHEVEVKSRLSYVPDAVAFYPFLPDVEPELREQRAVGLGIPAPPERGAAVERLPDRHPRLRGANICDRRTHQDSLGCR
jgi:ABC-type branched-subunit amino acid transport system ATPase component